MLAINEVLRGRYLIKSQLGRGGMGAVYEAYDNVFDTTVALKEILVDLTKVTTPKQQQMVRHAFEREAKILAMVKHEAFPHVRDYFVEVDRQYLVMELVDGEDLASLLERRQAAFPLANVLHWTSQLLDALDYLHTLNPPVIHRDIKPQNLKLTSRGKIKLLDFGIAKGKDSGAAEQTITNQTFVAATLNYSPLEQILRVLDPTFQEVITQRHDEKSTRAMSHQADARSDLYALGATIYHLLTNKLPIDALKRALELWGGKNDPLEYPSNVNPEIPQEISDWIMKAMAIEYENRFHSANDMLSALQIALESERNREEEAKRSELLAEQEKKRAQLAAEKEKIEQERRRMEEERRRMEEQHLRQAEINRKMIQEAEEKQKLAEQQAAEAEKRLLDSKGKELGATVSPFAQENYFPPTSLPPTPPEQEQPPASPFNQPTQLVQSEQIQQQTVLSPSASNTAESSFPPSTQTITSQNHYVTDSILADKQTKKSSKIFWIVPIVGILLLVVGGVFGVMMLMDSGGGEGSNNSIVNGTIPSNNDTTNTNKDNPPTVPEGMVLVKGAEFTMGTDKGDISEMPAHTKTVKSFFMDKYEVTREDYAKCVTAGNCTAPTIWKNGTFPEGTEKYPVVGVTYSQATAYAKFVNKRLPTEEEWEFAARGTDKRQFPWGNSWEKGKANAHGEGKDFTEVGKFSGASPFGIYDMVGNAWEWTSSEFKAYPNGKLPTDAPKGDVRVIRGGSFESADKFASTTYRVGWLAQGAPTYSQTSFRCVKDIE